MTFGSTFAVEGFTKTENLWTQGIYQFDQLSGQLSVIPEPTSFLLVGLGGVALLLRRKRG